MAVPKGDKFISFQSVNMRDADKQLHAFLAEKPRDVKHIQRGIIPGSRDIGYPKPNIDPEAIAAGMPRPIMPGSDTVYVIDIIYKDVE